MRRRRYLRLAGVAAVGMAAGCSDDGSETTAAGDTESGDQTDDGGGEQGTEEPVRGDRGEFDVRWEESLGVDAANAVNYDGAATDTGIYVGHDGGMTALTPEGDVRWDDDQFAEFQTVQVADGRVVALTRSFTLAVYSTDGDLQWNEELVSGDGAVPGELSASGSYVAAFGPDGLVTFDAETGDRLATGPDGEDVFLADGVAVVADSFDGVVGVDAASGEEAYRREFGQNLMGGGALLGDRIVAPTAGVDDKRLVGVDPTSGSLEWESESMTLSLFTEVGGNQNVAAVYADPREDAALRGYDPGTGDRLFETDLGDITVPFQPPAVDGQTVVTETGDGVAAVDVSSGDRLGGTNRITIVLEGLAHDGTFYDCGRDVTAYDI